MTGKAAGKNTKKELIELVCESCGAEFSCGANVGKCWCFALEIEMEILAELKENFERCLCADCLNALTALEK